jgi:hypothetical protein
MSGFWTEYGEEKIWYLQMRKYANESLYEELGVSQNEVVDAGTRFDWYSCFFETLRSLHL